jgi:LmbE family N-acetylglucosaminyl deacetylase
MKVLVIAPHADDETLGVGGTLLRHRAAGDSLHWLIVTDRQSADGSSADAVARREAEVAEVAGDYGFASVHRLGLVPAQLDAQPLAGIVDAIGKVVRQVAPEIVYLPFRGDIHTDHGVVFDAGAACTKWFRYPSVRRVLCYEVTSETEQALNPETARFAPNYYVDISAWLDAKIRICGRYASEVHAFPFPRSDVAMRALAQTRGAACGAQAAEAFMLLRETVA